MRKLFFILPLVFMLGCSLFTTKKDAVDPDEYVIGSKSGIIYMRDGRTLVFTKSIVTATVKTIRVQSELLHFSVFWVNVDKLEILNYDRESSNETLKNIEKEDNKNIIEKVKDSGIKVKSN